MFLPRRLGMPDGGSGYAYLTDGQLGQRYDCLLDPCRVTRFLGDGWYWVG